MPDREYVTQALQRAIGYLNGIQDADTWEADEYAAELIDSLSQQVSMLEGWEGVITLNVHMR
jgi:hypothetical protein